MIPFNFGNSMIGTFPSAVQRSKNAGAVVEDKFNQQFQLNKECLQKENELFNLNSSINENKGEKIFTKQDKTMHKAFEITEIQYEKQSDTKNKNKTTSLDNFPDDQNLQINFANSISNINQRPHPPPSTFSKSKSNYSDLVRNSTDFLRSIISSLQTEDPYDMSDWEDEEAMKPMELDLNVDVVNGKKIPSWASGKQLAIAVSKQNQTDGDRIFQDLDRRVNIVTLFGTNVFPYYQQRFR